MVDASRAQLSQRFPGLSRALAAGDRMRFSLRFLLMLLPALAALILGFFAVMDRIEHKAVVNEFGQRAVLIRESLHDALLDTSGKAESAAAIQRLLNRVGVESRH